MSLQKRKSLHTVYPFVLRSIEKTTQMVEKSKISHISFHNVYISTQHKTQIYTYIRTLENVILAQENKNE
jgi:hypothetical protein